MARRVKPEQFYEPTHYNIRTKSERHLMCRFKAMRMTKAQARFVVRCALEDGFLPENATNAYVKALASNDAASRADAVEKIRFQRLAPACVSWRDND